MTAMREAMISSAEPDASSVQEASIVLLTAIRNEAAVMERFLTEIRTVFQDCGLLHRVRLVIVDDGSTDQTLQEIARVVPTLPGLCVDILPLASNRGNQLAMAYGVRQLASRLTDAFLLTLDADGEDDVTRLPSLVRLLEDDPTRMVFVYRDDRQERLVIRMFYAAYRSLYRFLTGQRLIPCNVMAIPGSMVPMIAGSPLLSLHFSYPALRLGLPYRAVPMARRRRYGGRSSQNLSLLIQHGLIGLTIFYEQVVARLIFLSRGVVGITAIAALWILVVRFVSPQTFPVGFATGVFLTLLGFSFISVVSFVVFCLACAMFRLLIEQGRDA
jgi:glycosyltransferase involved in cell wall biosynthesis